MKATEDKWNSKQQASHGILQSLFYSFTLFSITATSILKIVKAIMKLRPVADQISELLSPLFISAQIDWTLKNTKWMIYFNFTVLLQAIPS